jgi:hypothetical protein
MIALHGIGPFFRLKTSLCLSSPVNALSVRVDERISATGAGRAYPKTQQEQGRQREASAHPAELGDSRERGGGVAGVDRDRGALPASRAAGRAGVCPW